MENELNDKQEAESSFIRQWCLTIIDFIYSTNNIPVEVIELRKQAFSDENKIKCLERAKPEFYLRGLRQAYNDLNEIAMIAPDQIQKNLNEKLLSQFGRDLNIYSKDVLNRIEKIIKRQEIIDDEEFRIIDQKVSELSQIDARSQQVKLLR